jgi:hypothetical protein
LCNVMKTVTDNALVMARTARSRARKTSIPKWTASWNDTNKTTRMLSCTQWATIDPARIVTRTTKSCDPHRIEACNADGYAHGEHDVYVQQRRSESRKSDEDHER